MNSSIVLTVRGKLQGTKEDGVHVWRGIRYAKAPVAALRFRKPEPVEPWKGIQKAVEFGPSPPQQSGVGIGMSGGEVIDEDCLFLNIWSPAADGHKRPVMVWIPGGAYISGSGSVDMYNGSRLAKNGNLVVVTINYRLGAFGYLDFTGLPDCSSLFDSNPGLRDQVAALVWVKENIASFGGDPDQVTIFGESAGGNAVTTLLTVPTAKGLFARAIAESSAPTAVYKKETALLYAMKFLNILGLAKTEAWKLKDLPVELLIEAAGVLLAENSMTLPGSLPFAPVVDGVYLPEYPLEAIRNGAVSGIPLMIGTNRDEATLFDRRKPPLIPTTQELIHKMFQCTDPEAEGRITKAYPSFPEKRALLNIGRDAVFHIPTIWYAESYSRNSDTWMYRFDYQTASLRFLGMGATHGIEIIFVFQTFNSILGKQLTKLGSKRSSFALSERLQQYWINFARTGNPNNHNGEHWPKYEEKLRKTLIFNTKDSVTKDPDVKIRLAWENIDIYV